MSKRALTTGIHLSLVAFDRVLRPIHRGEKRTSLENLLKRKEGSRSSPHTSADNTRPGNNSAPLHYRGCCQQGMCSCCIPIPIACPPSCSRRGREACMAL